MSTISNSESSTSSSSQTVWWTPSSWVPDTTNDPSSTLSTSVPDYSLTTIESYSPSLSWTEMSFSTVTDSVSSISALPSPSSSPTLMVMSSTSSLFGSIETREWSIPKLTFYNSFHIPLFLEVSHPDSTRQSPKGTPVKFKTAQIVGMSFGAFVGLLAIGILLVYLLTRLGRRRPKHQRSYSDPDEKYDDELATMTSLNNRGNDFGAAVHGRDRGDSLGESMSSRRILDRSYYDTRRSFSDGGPSSTTPLLQLSLSQSDNRGSDSFGLGLGDVYESPVSQFRSAGSFDEEFPGPSTLSGPPPYSRILPPLPILRPLRPLPVPTNPRPLQPQRRSNSIQVRMQTMPPLISSSTTSLPLFSSPPSNHSSFPSSGSGSGPSPPSSSSSSPPSFTGFRNTDQFISPVLDKLPPLQPQRRTEESIKVPPSSWSLSSNSNSPVIPFRPTPSISFKEVQHPNAFDNLKPKKLTMRRKHQHARNRSRQSGSLSLTSESFRCAGEKAMNDEDRDFFAHEGVFADSPPSSYSQFSAMRTTERGILIDP